jgi:hypothetical protein
MAAYQSSSGEAPALCAEAKNLIVGYLDTVEECDRLHLMLLAARRGNDAAAAEGYRALLQEDKLKLQAARGRLRDHQKAHCPGALRFEGDLTQ